MKLSRWLDVDVNKCVENIGSRFEMILIGAAKVHEVSRQHKHDYNNHSTDNDYNNLSALLDIQEGTLTRDYLKNVGKPAPRVHRNNSRKVSHG